MSKLLLDLAEELDAEEDVFVSLLLLDLASEEEGFTTLLLESSFLTEELLLLSPLTELEEFFTVETEELEDRSSSLEAGATEEDSSPHATKKIAQTRANTKQLIVDCFVVLLLAMTFFIRPPDKSHQTFWRNITKQTSFYAENGIQSPQFSVYIYE